MHTIVCISLSIYLSLYSIIYTRIHVYIYIYIYIHRLYGCPQHAQIRMAVRQALSAANRDPSWCAYYCGIAPKRVRSMSVKLSKGILICLNIS